MYHAGGPRPYEAIDDEKVSTLDRIVQRRLTEIIESINRVLSSQEFIDARKVAILRRPMQCLAPKFCSQIAAHRHRRVYRKEEAVPAEFADRLINGENPIRVFREYRGLTHEQLAKAAHIARPYPSEIESGKKQGSVTLLKAIAAALKVDLDDVAG